MNKLLCVSLPLCAILAFAVESGLGQTAATPLPSDVADLPVGAFALPDAIDVEPVGAPALPPFRVPAYRDPAPYRPPPNPLPLFTDPVLSSPPTKHVPPVADPYVPGRIYVPGDYPTIQAAINASWHGDTILVEEGTYTEHIRFNGKAITVASMYLVNRESGVVRRTVIDGGGRAVDRVGSVVNFVDGEDSNSVLYGFTITGGVGRKALRLGNTWYWLGGGVYAFNATPRISHNIIRGNVVRGDGALGGGVGVISLKPLLPYVILEENTISGNETEASTREGSGGAGVALINVNGRMVGNRIERNTARGEWPCGGGAFVGAGGAWTGNRLPSVFIDRNVFSENTLYARGDRGAVGGGLVAVGTGAMVISNNRFERNSCTSVAGWAEGGGLCLDDHGFGGVGRKTIANNAFVENSVSRGGGMTACGGAIFLYLSDALVTGCEIYANDVNGLGGGVSFFASKFRIQNSVIARNRALMGGGVHVRYGLQAAAEHFIVNCTIADNDAEDAGGALIVEGAGKHLVVLNSILWNNTAKHNAQIGLMKGSLAEVHYTDVESGWSQGTENIDAEPKFVAGDASYSLSTKSPCIGRGVCGMQINGICYQAPTCDCGDHVRPCPPGTRPDLGAHEEETVVRKDPTMVTGAEEEPSVPSEFALFQNYPNPFNPTTEIRYQVSGVSNVKLVVCDILGREVAVLVNELKSPGRHEVTFDATGLPTGVYVYRLEAGSSVAVRKMVLMK